METKQEILGGMIQRLAILLNKEEAELNEDTTFVDLSMKSVNYSQLTTYLEDQCDVEIPFMEFRRKKTLGEAAQYVVELIEN